jgi:MSHA pilin protein MshA
LSEKGRKGGFTIIEVIVVLVIVGVLAATAAPKFADLLTGSLLSVEAASNMVKSDIRYVQELAMSTHQQKSIAFSSGSDSYYLPYSSDPRDLQGVTLGNNLTVTFNPLGEPIAGGGQSLSVGTKTVTITNYTGKVNVQ